MPTKLKPIFQVSCSLFSVKAGINVEPLRSSLCIGLSVLVGVLGLVLDSEAKTMYLLLFLNPQLVETSSYIYYRRSGKETCLSLGLTHLQPFSPQTGSWGHGTLLSTGFHPGR